MYNDDLSDYQSRIREMERQLDEQRLNDLARAGIAQTRQNMQSAETFRQEDEELRRLADLREEERRLRETPPSPSMPMQYYGGYYNPAQYEQELRRKEAEASRLRLMQLQQQIRMQEEENRRLRDAIGKYPAYPQYYPPVQPVRPVQQPQPTPQPQQPIQQQPVSQPPLEEVRPAQPQMPPMPQIYVTQQVSQQPAPQQIAQQPPIYPSYVQSIPLEEVRSEPVKEEKPKDAVLSIPLEEVPKDGQQGVVYRNERLTFLESYALLDRVQKSFCDGLRAYAVQKSGKPEKIAKYHLSVGSGSNVVMKLCIKSGTVFALFKIENEKLRELRLNARADGTMIRVKETEMPVIDKASFETAKDMIDLRIAQMHS